MSSDLTLSPATAVELYCLRTRIEIMFSMLKTLLHAFCFHFWTQALPRHRRRPQANRYLQTPDPKRLFFVCPGATFKPILVSARSLLA